jgi:hypothetical protein
MNSTLRTVLLVAAVPVAAVVTSIAMLLALAPELPTELAVHWGVEGVDRVDGLGAFIGAIAGVVPAFTVFMTVAAVLALRAGTTRAYLRLLVASSVWFGVAVAGGMLGTAIAQRGVSDVSTLPASTPLVPLLVCAVGGAAIAAALALLVPAVPEPVRGASTAAAGIRLAPGEAVYWSASVRSPAGVLAVYVGVLAFVVVVFALAGLPWWASALVFVLLLALASLLGWHVVVDRRGLRATGLFGYPRISVAADRVESASVVDVSTFREFGGWGVRVDASGRLGIIVRSGEAIEVERVGKAPLVITVPDAATGAAVLASVAVPSGR